MPVPLVTTWIIRSRSVVATCSELTRTGFAAGRSLRSVTIRVGLRMPPSAIACATEAISSGVASTWPCPIALTPSSRAFGIEAGITLRGGSTIRVACWSKRLGGELKPYRSAASTSRSEPIFGPSGTKTLLHDSAKASTKLPPHASLWALATSRPSTTVEVWIGNWSVSLTTPASSAAVVVISLKVEPGGCGPENAMPARASTEPSRASSTATPP